MAGMRDRRIHGYYDVNYSVVWEVVTGLIPPLQPIIKQVLEDMETETGSWPIRHAKNLVSSNLG